MRDKDYRRAQEAKHYKARMNILSKGNMELLKEENLKPFNQQYEMTCSVDISVRESASQRILNKFALIEGFRYELISQE